MRGLMKIYENNYVRVIINDKNAIEQHSGALIFASHECVIIIRFGFFFFFCVEIFDATIYRHAQPAVLNSTNLIRMK